MLLPAKLNVRAPRPLLGFALVEKTDLHHDNDDYVDDDIDSGDDEDD